MNQKVQTKTRRLSRIVVTKLSAARPESECMRQKDSHAGEKTGAEDAKALEE